jgi:uncharacterized protein
VSATLRSDTGFASGVAIRTIEGAFRRRAILVCRHNPHRTVRPFQSIHFAATTPGTRLIVTGAVHGNETCGTIAIRRVVDEIDQGRLRIVRGAVTFVPVTNPLAYERGRREGERNLNRKLAPSALPREFEDHVANWLCPLLAAHDGLLDLHSFQTGAEPFVLIGPPDNAGALEPFAHAAREESVALRLGVQRIVDGWLSTYAAGVEQRRARWRPTCTPTTAWERPSTCGAPAAGP